MSRHTEGPWDVHCGHTIRAVRGEVAIPLADVLTPWRPITIDSPSDCDVVAEGYANARLIAAAPDLLAACEVAELRLDMNQPEHGDCHCASCASLRMIRAAITKAREGGR